MSSDSREALRALLVRRHSSAAILCRHGRIADEWYSDEAGPETLFPVYSITKSFAATAVGLLADDRRLSLDAPVATWAPEWQMDSRRGVTVRHLLQMTSGLELDDERLYGQADQVAFALERPLSSEPGSGWKYGNTACVLLSLVISAAGGEEMQGLLRRSVFDPLGFGPVDHWVVGGRSIPYSGMALSARDLASFGQLYLDGGVARGVSILSGSFVREATAPSQDVFRGYGHLWWVNANRQWPDLPPDAFAARGIYGNELLVVPSAGMVFVRLVGKKPRAGIPINHAGKLALQAIAEL